MKKHRRRLTTKRKKFIMLNSLLVLFLVLGLGYSMLSTNLSILGNITLKKRYVSQSGELYNVLKTAAEEGTYAKEYTDAHQDSMNSSLSTQKIYYYYGSNATNGTAILDKNNVLFAGHCWQMIRTTDTGGVKMIYNGEADNGKCLNTRGTHVGYAASTTQSMSTTYYYGTSYTYDSTNSVFSLDGTVTTGTIQTGQYTCRQTTSTGTCATLYLVDTLSSGTTYYVLPLNGNSNYSQFGALQFNVNDKSPADFGYMYNTRYANNSKSASTEIMLSSNSLYTSYWYANSAIWGTPTAYSYNLVDAYRVSATTEYPNLVGKYTFRNATQTYTNTSVYYIAAVNNTTYYYIQLGNETGTTNDLSYYNYQYTYGDSYTDNGNGTYTINSPTTVNRSDWYTSYSNVGAGKYVCKNAVNNTCSELWYTTATSNTSMTYIKVANNYKYSKGFNWDGSKYVLDNDTSTSFWNINDSTNKTSINNAHYTCWNDTGECTTISYIYYIIGTMPEYINITNGKSIEDAVNEMLYDDNVNTTNSTIKSGVDAWYKHYLLEDYDYILEDTIYCNDRSQRNADTNGWNPNGGSTSTYMYFYGASDLSCPNDTDKFSVSNNKAKLTYKVGLMSYHEMNLLNNSNARKTGQYYWLASPYYFSYYSAGRLVGTSGDMDYNGLAGTSGVRPAVSLITGTEYSSGDGSKANPYVVDTN